MPGGWEIVIILGVLVLLFGAKRLPDMARSIGQSARVFKGEMKGLKQDDDTPADKVVDAPPAALPPSAVVPTAPVVATVDAPQPAPAAQPGSTGAGQ